MDPILRAVCLLLLPGLVLIAGGWAMRKAAGWARVHALLARAAPGDRRPLGLRPGYDADAVRRHWAVLDADALRREKRVMELDLVFPLVFVGTLACSLVATWVSLHRPVPLAAVLLGLAALLLADWTENLHLIGQVKRVMAGDELQPGRVRIASLATRAKLLLSGAAFLALLASLLLHLFGAAPGPPGRP